MKESINEIMKALVALGVVSLEEIAPDRIKVEVNGEYFGIWDAVKKTFVD